MYLSELKALPVTKLVELARSLDIETASRLRKQELMFTILKRKAKEANKYLATVFSKFHQWFSVFEISPKPLHGKY